MKNIFKISLLIFLEVNTTFSLLVLPFNYYSNSIDKNIDLNTISGNDFVNIITNKMVSTLSIGTPKKSLDLFLTMDYYTNFFIGEGYCEKDSISFYEPKSSSSFSNNSWDPYPFDDLRNMTIGKDECTFFSDYKLKTNKTISDLQLYYGKMINISNENYVENKICGILGLRLHRILYENIKYKNIYEILKLSNINNSEYWSLEIFDDKQKKNFNNKYDGFLIFGANEDEYLNKTKQKNLDDIKLVYADYYASTIEWITSFFNIYYNKTSEEYTKMQTYKKVRFNSDINFVHVTKEYFGNITNDFFSDYISKGICKIQKISEFYLRYQFIHCDKSFNQELKKFPTLYFEHKTMEQIFELTYQDVFIEINGRIMFSLIYDPWNPDFFTLGKIFMKKYQLIFNINSKLFGFIGRTENYEIDENQDESKFNLNQIIWIIVLSVLLVGIIIGVLVGKKIFEAKRKIKANELDDDYDYSINKE